MFPAVLVALFSIFSASAAAADSCETLRAEIEAKIRDAGVKVFSVTTVDVAADVPGKVVGSCGQGSRKIVYLKGEQSASPAAAATPSAAPAPPAQPAPARPASDAILTECKPGFVSIRGECKKL